MADTAIADSTDAAFLAGERHVEIESGRLKKELKLRDLVCAQIAYIIGWVWLGYAGKLGPGHLLYWLPAVFLFYVPSGIVVLYLSSEMPLEGGIYQWVKLRLGPMAGFLVGLNLWATITLLLVGFSSTLSNEIFYFAGPGHAWITENRVVTMAVGTVLMGTLVLVVRRGLVLGKWFQNVAGILLFATFLTMVLFALPRWLGLGAAVASAPIGFVLPATTLVNLNLLGKMGFAAFCGLDGSSIFAGECHDKDTIRTIRRSIWVAAPIIAAIYIVGTACVITFTAPNAIDMTTPSIQAISRAAHDAGVAFLLVPLFAGAAILTTLGVATLYFNIATRLPMVAGWDNLLPASLSRLHPRFGTPTGSIFLIGIIAVAVTVLANLGVGGQEAFQTSVNAALICWALTYLAMFSIPLIAKDAPMGVKVAALSGFAMTLLFAVLSIFPAITVANPMAFTAKVGGVVLALNIAGVLYFRRMRIRRRDTQSP
jgi:glutamate:GABA antiporter